MKKSLHYYELRNGNKALFALIRSRTPEEAKEQMMELVDGGQWSHLVIPKKDAKMFLAKYRTNTVYEATYIEDKPKLITLNNGGALARPN